MTNTLAHTEDCLCVPCMMADMDAHVAANGGTVHDAQQTAPEETRYRFAGQGAGRGIVRTVSERQIKFILSLINSRDTKNLVILPGQTVDPTKLHTMGVVGAKALIEKLLNCPVVSVRMASDGQRRFIASLNAQIIDPGYKITEADILSVTFAEVNDVLALLKSIIAAEKADAPKRTAAKRTEVTEGAYWHGNLIARVQRTKDGKRMYAKLQASEGSKSFEYVPGLINKLKAEDMLSIDDMKAFAQDHKACADCGTRMSHPVSLARGIGPVCSGKGYTL